MQLGRGPGNGPIISAAKFLDAAPIGTVIRNGCDSAAVFAEGTYFIKIASSRHSSGVEWAPYYPRTQAIHHSFDWPIQSRDIFLPVQVVERG